MAFIYCNICRWSQDDFWDKEGYNPFRQDIINDLKEELFRDKVYGDKFMFDDLGIVPEYDNEGYYADGRKIVAAVLIQKAKSILNMRVRTGKEWEEIKDTFCCPKCGNNDFGID